MIVYAPRKVTLAAARAAGDPHCGARRRRACPTANIASTCCSARFRRRRRSSRPPTSKPKGVQFKLTPDLRRHHPGHRPPRQPPGDARASPTSTSRRRMATPSGRPRPDPHGLALDLWRSPRAEGRASRIRSPSRRGSPSTPKSASATSAFRSPSLQARSAAGPVTVEYIETYDDGTPSDRRNPGGAALGRDRVSAEPDPMSGGRFWLRKTAMLLALCAGSIAASAPAPRQAAPAAWTADPGRTIHPRRQHSPAAARRHGARLQCAGRHMCRLRRLFDRARRADAHRPRREEGERLGVQGNATGSASTMAALQVTLRREEDRGDRAGHDPRDARRLVRPDRRARPAGSGSASSR